MIMMSKKIFSVAQTKTQLIPVHIETVSSNGLYKFEILGTGKNSNELKQKIYTALRAEGIFNLKSDNRKIYISLFSKEQLFDTNDTELALLLSCYSCVSKRDFWAGMICIGRVSITGEISTTSKLAQTIGISIDRKIDSIICPYDDFISLPTHIKEYAKTQNIQIHAIKDIKSLLDSGTKKQNKVSTKPTESTPSKIHTQQEISDVFSIVQEDAFLWALIVSICGDHNILIYKDKTKNIEDISNLIYKIHPPYETKQIIDFSVEFNLQDFELSNIPFFISDREVFHTRYKNSDIKKIYYIGNCPCENKENDCTCSGRSKKLYKTKINTHIENTSTIKVWAQKHDLKLDTNKWTTLKDSICSIKNMFIDPENTFKQDTANYFEHVCEKLSACDKKTLFKVCLTLQKIESFISNKHTPITKKTILLAFSLVRNKFQE